MSIKKTIMENKKAKILFIFLLNSIVLNITIYSENLIRNSGFEEEGNNSVPLYWSLFVQPQEGSFGKIDKKIFHSGKNSVYLNNTNSYSREPMNNWSQRLSISVSRKKRVHFEGWIKTENVSKSYFLIQFWKQNPAHIIDSKKTEILAGTNNWKKMTEEIEVPEMVDFVVVRCVIEGTGSAWFDDVSLDYIDEQNEESKDNTVTGKEENENIEDGIKKIEQRLEELLKENTQLREKIKILEEENKKIKEGLEEINIRDREKLESSSNEKIEIEKSNAEGKKVPILVPHKKNWRTIKRQQE